MDNPSIPIPIPGNLALSDILALANHKSAPYIKKRRNVSDNRAIYSVRSDFLYYYTDMWYRNRNADTDRVTQIMRSIEKEGEVDNRIYLAHIQDCPVQNRLLAFDGNHRREALIKLFLLKRKTYWVDLDILTNVRDKEVIEAFKRVNQSICLPDAYIEYDNEAEADTEDKEPYPNDDIMNNPIAKSEYWIQQVRERWPRIILDKNRTKIPYCTKNDFATFLMDYFKYGGKDTELMVRLELVNEENKRGIIQCSPQIQNTARCLDCYLFTSGISKIRQCVLPKIAS
jgi:hypothetical protein